VIIKNVNWIQEKIIQGDLMVSVVMRCRNEERYIGYAIQSVLDFFDNPEIIIIDNNSTDDSMKIVKSFNFNNINIYNIDDYTPGKSLNYGISKCTTDIILVMSAHSEIISLDINKIINCLSEHCAVWGKQLPIWNGKKISRRYIWSNFGEVDTINYFSDNEHRYFLHNAFTFYNRKFLMENPFDENLYGKEDRYWIINKIDNGFSSYYDSESICNHHFTKNGATWRGMA
jgi:glycosyltransferase involved in cell wall biosynthesis